MAPSGRKPGQCRHACRDRGRVAAAGWWKHWTQVERKSAKECSIEPTLGMQGDSIPAWHSLPQEVPVERRRRRRTVAMRGQLKAAFLLALAWPVVSAPFPCPGKLVRG
ncbi:MAG: hypothetical protein ACPIOQ_70015, partial [Promethearchaeia archaeon]